MGRDPKQARLEKERTRTEKRKAKKENKKDEWDTLQVEERLAKKLRKGLITEEEFERELKKAGGGF